MADWKQAIAKVAGNVETHFDKLKFRLDNKLNRINDIHIVTYLGYGNHEHVRLRGRVLEDHTVGVPDENDSVWRNLLNTYRRFDSDEIPNAPLEADFAGETVNFLSDVEGFFNVDIPFDEPPSEDITQQAHLHYRDRENVSAEATVIIPPRNAQFGVISDIDDTVLRTDVTNLLKLARNTFLRNAHTRLPFPGVAALYRGLQAGTAQTYNPVFYVSNSPWNLHDLLRDFFELRGLPQGPLFLRDIGLTDDYIGADSTHKARTVRHLLEVYPELPFILIGDSGEHDADIYRDVVAEFPERIKAVYIRDVNPNLDDSERDRRVNAIAEEVQREYDVPMLLTRDSLVAADHAATSGFITQAALRDVQTDYENDMQQNDIEQLLDDMQDQNTQS